MIKITPPFYNFVAAETDGELCLQVSSVYAYAAANVGSLQEEQEAILASHSYFCLPPMDLRDKK